MALIHLTETNHSRPLYIRRDAIASVIRALDDTATLVTIDGGQQFAVQEDVDAVVNIVIGSIS